MPDFHGFSLDLTNYKGTAYWAGQWTGESISFVSGGGIGAVKSGGKYLLKNGITGTAKNLGNGAMKKATHFYDDVIMNASKKQCGFFKRLIGKGCFVAGTLVHIESLPCSFADSYRRVPQYAPDAYSGITTQVKESLKTIAIEDVPLGKKVWQELPDFWSWQLLGGGVKLFLWFSLAFGCLEVFLLFGVF